MIKVLASKKLAFQSDSIGKDGFPVEVTTKVGFCELPDWVEKTDLFKAAVAEGSLKQFKDSNESEKVQKKAESVAKPADTAKPEEPKEKTK
jgi:hypothetical protein